MSADLTAHDYYHAMVRTHVEQPLNVHQMLVDLLKKTVGPDAEVVATLSQQGTWMHFMPPLYIFLITCVEVFLEKLFIESYRRPDGRPYRDIEEWRGDIKESFRGLHEWDDMQPIHKKFSFQRLDDVDVLYAGALDVRLSEYPKWNLVKLAFEKRHLFTHRGGLVDTKFLAAHNTFHAKEGDVSQLKSNAAIGKQAYLLPMWLRDSIDEMGQFVDYVVMRLGERAKSKSPA